MHTYFMFWELNIYPIVWLSLFVWRPYQVTTQNELVKVPPVNLVLSLNWVGIFMSVFMQFVLNWVSSFKWKHENNDLKDNISILYSKWMSYIVSLLCHNGELQGKSEQQQFHSYLPYNWQYFFWRAVLCNPYFLNPNGHTY